MRAELSPRQRRWVVLVAALLVAGLTARLGLWQLDRAAEKLALQAAREAADRQPPLRTLADVEAGSEHRLVQLRGRWRADLQLWLGNRPHGEQMGFLLLTPLQLDSGALLWVQRGWHPRSQAGYAPPPWPTTADGSVQVSGRLLRHASRAFELGAGNAGAVRQNLDLSVSPEAGRPLLPWVLWQREACAPLRCDWPAPDLGLAKHRGYALQWFALSLLTLGLYVWFQVLPRRRSAGRAA
jgi:surfeit locus 1 family protein